ncbi:MAG: DUF3482 domain-containing protein [Idiomarina sp.]|nr:DUF3482 domain-containing protein [Idiomarina sp.]
MDSIKLAIVGHTNVGKTSLLRTLLRDATFGQVSDQPSTTRDVSVARVEWQSSVVEWYDTPGLEDGVGLYEYLQHLAQRQQLRHDGPKLLQQFLASPEADASYAQEAKVIRQLLQCDAGLYVIDTRDPVLAKFQDELAILSMAARPLLPILNFSSSPESQQSAWQQALANVNLHAWVAFDSVTPEAQGEALIYANLATLLPTRRALLSAWQQEIQQRRTQRQHAASQIIAELIVDCSALRLHTTTQDADALNQQVNDLQQLVRQREQHATNSLFKLYGFSVDSVDINVLQLSQGRWQHDLFNPHSLKSFGIQTSKVAAGGAAVGAGIDVMMLGTTLGGATLLGATLGGAWQSWRSYGQRVKDKLRGYRELSVETSVLKLLVARCQQLTRHLDSRAHANQSPSTLTVDTAELADFEPFFEHARGFPGWSSIASAEQFQRFQPSVATTRSRLASRQNDDPERQHLVDKLAQRLTLQRIESK